MPQFKEILLFVISFISVNIAVASPKVDVYPAPTGIAKSSKFSVDVKQDGKYYSSFVYYSTPLDNDADNASKIREEVIKGINENEVLRNFYFQGKVAPLNTDQSCSYTCFSFNGNVQVKIAGGEAISSFKILPSSAGIEGLLDGNELTFSLDKPQKLAVVINGDYLNPLFLFADALEQGVPDKQATGTLIIKEGDDCSQLKDELEKASVIWFEPGVHDIGISFPVYSNQTIYMAGGSYLRGSISGFMASNVTIRGRGILAGDHISRKYVLGLKKDRSKNNWERLHYHAINMLSEQNKTNWNSFADYPGEGCDNLLVEGITIASPRQFFIRATGVPITIYNVKMVGSWPYNTDGISTIGQANTTVFDCFFHCNDDGIYVTPNNCHIHHCNFWQGNNGCVFQFAWGSSPLNQGGGYIHDCNILHVGHVAEANNRMVIGSRKKGPGNIGNIHFKNIEIEGPVWSLFRIETNGGGELGSFDHLTFENIRVHGPVIHKSKIVSSKGRSAHENSTSWIKDVVFKNVMIEGRKMTRKDVDIDDFQVQDIEFEP